MGMEVIISLKQTFFKKNIESWYMLIENMFQITFHISGIGRK